MNQAFKGKLIRVQKDEFEQLNQDLQSIFLSEFVLWLNENLNVSLKWCDKIKMKITKHDLLRLKHFGGDLKSDKYLMKMDNDEICEMTLIIKDTKTNDIDIWLIPNRSWQNKYKSFRIDVILEIPQIRVYRGTAGTITETSNRIEFTAALTQDLMKDITQFDINVTFFITQQVLK